MASNRRIHRNILFKTKIHKLPVPTLTPDRYYYFLCLNSTLIDRGQIEATRVVITKELRRLKLISKKRRSLWVPTLFTLPYTKKSSQSRMGKGKGSIDCYKTYLNPYSVIFKLRNISDSLALRLVDMISCKLSFELAIVKHQNGLVCSISRQ